MNDTPVFQEVQPLQLLHEMEAFDLIRNLIPEDFVCSYQDFIKTERKAIYFPMFAKYLFNQVSVTLFEEPEDEDE